MKCDTYLLFSGHDGMEFMPNCALRMMDVMSMSPALNDENTGVRDRTAPRHTGTAIEMAVFPQSKQAVLCDRFYCRNYSKTQTATHFVSGSELSTIVILICWFVESRCYATFTRS